MKVLITGSKGQLGHALQFTAPEVAELLLTDMDLDITDAGAVQNYIEQHRPDVVINGAAYTAVDKAESDVELAGQINAQGPKHLAAACAAVNAVFVQVSTDFVFDGTAHKPYLEDDAPAPISVYGSTKLEGEQFALAYPRSLVVRTAWLYSCWGNNFVKTILRLVSERDALTMIADQIGTPTSALTLARYLWSLIEVEAEPGIYHCTDAGTASWYDFAIAIQEEAVQYGLLRKEADIAPIPTSAYPTPAARPHYSVISKDKLWSVTGVPGQHWRQSLREVIKQLAEVDKVSE